jgi:hypothetical protein
LLLALPLAVFWAIVIYWVSEHDFLGTHLDRGDFESEAEALEFVSDHLPAALPPDSTVSVLTYDRFTDWMLRASVSFPDREALNTYLEKLRSAAESNPDYCGDPTPPAAGGYFLKKWWACGTVTRGPQPNLLVIQCNTR